MANSPMNPIAGVSGPGKYAVRTDNLQMGSTSYGEGVDTAAIKSGAPLSTTPDQRPMPATEVRDAAMAPVTGLFDPSSRPGEPVTSGIDIGAGVGSNALMMAKSSEKTSDILAKMLPFDTDGSIAILYQQAVARGD
jgi:hypothetical protein